VIKDRWKGEIEGDDPRVAARDWGYWSRLLLRYWSSIILTALVVIAAAAAVAQAQTPIYTAQATVAVYPAAGTSSGVQPFVMGTEKGIASSGAVLSLASKSLLIPVTKLQHGLSVTVPADSDLLVISYSDPDPRVAQSTAEGIAHAYVAYRTSTNQPTSTHAASPPPSPAGAVQASVVTDAVLPAAPVNPNRLLIMGVAAALGLALGVGVALLRDLMDDSLRGHADLEIQANAPVLAQIPAMPRRRHREVDALAVVESPNSRVADAYLSLRTRVLHAAASRQAKTLLVTSPGGEDKAAIAANLAAAVAMSGRRVVLVCADPRWGRADALFGMDRDPGLSGIVQGHTKLADALRVTAVPQLQVLPSGPADASSSSFSQSPVFREVLTALTTDSDFVVVDSPPVLASPDTTALVEPGVMLLLVADARATSRARVREAANELSHVHDSVIGWVLDHERGVRRLGDPSGQSPVADPSMPPMQVPPMPATPARPLTWDDISGESNPPPSPQVAAVTVRNRIPDPGTRRKAITNGSYEG
jgi:polysaccharide biosynthesis transport protein